MEEVNYNLRFKLNVEILTKFLIPETISQILIIAEDFFSIPNIRAMSIMVNRIITA